MLKVANKGVKKGLNKRKKGPINGPTKVLSNAPQLSPLLVPEQAMPKQGKELYTNSLT